MSSIKDYSERITQQSPNIPNEASIVLKNIENQSFLMHFIASNLSSKLTDKQALLEENDIPTRAERLLQLLQSELQLVELKNEITNKTILQNFNNQKEGKAIQLGSFVDLLDFKSFYALVYEKEMQETAKRNAKD
jgi:ATP-dependent Lon protease